MNSFGISQPKYLAVFRCLAVILPNAQTNLDYKLIFSAGGKLRPILNILLCRYGTIHADLHVHLPDWISHQMDENYAQ
jgi:hypothetical protein